MLVCSNIGLRLRQVDMVQLSDFAVWELILSLKCIFRSLSLALAAT